MPDTQPIDSREIRQTKIPGVFMSQAGDVFVLKHARNHGRGSVIMHNGQAAFVAKLYPETWGDSPARYPRYQAGGVDLMFPVKRYKKVLYSSQDPFLSEIEDVYALIVVDRLTIDSAARYLGITRTYLVRKIKRINTQIMQEGLDLELIPLEPEKIGRPRKTTPAFNLDQPPPEFCATLTNKQQKMLRLNSLPDKAAAKLLGLSSPLSVYQMRRRIHDRYRKWCQQNPSTLTPSQKPPIVSP